MKTGPRIYIYWDLPELQSVYTRDYNDLCKKILYFRRVAAINPSVCLETVAGRFRLHEALKELSHKDITPNMAWEFRRPRKIVLSSFSMKSHRKHHSSQSPLTKTLSSGTIHYSDQDENNKALRTRYKTGFSALMRKTLKPEPYSIIFLWQFRGGNGKAKRRFLQRRNCQKSQHCGKSLLKRTFEKRQENAYHNCAATWHDDEALRD